MLLPPGTCQGKGEPQVVQKQAVKRFASGNLYKAVLSWPCNQRNCSTGTNRFAPCALPLRFRQREQKQYWKLLVGAVISNATLAHRQLPFMVGVLNFINRLYGLLACSLQQGK